MEGAEPRGYGFAVPVVAVAVCPCPPLLVPSLASGAAAELDDLRGACDAALGRLRSAAGTSPASLVVVGVDTTTRWLAPPYGGTFAPWGEAVEVGATGAALPLSLLVAAWLLERDPAAASVTGWGGDDSSRLRMLAVAADAPAAECERLGRELAAAGGDTALLVMGDGSACRGEKAPGYHDPRAEAFDAAAADALAAGDPGRLAALDAGLAGELLAAGRAPWQVLAAAAQASPPGAGRPGAGPPGAGWEAVLHYAEAPYGVGYLVASWLAGAGR